MPLQVFINLKVINGINSEQIHLGVAMEFSVKSGSPEKQRSACIVVGVYEPRRLSPIGEQLDRISDGYIRLTKPAQWKRCAF